MQEKPQGDSSQLDVIAIMLKVRAMDGVAALRIKVPRLFVGGSTGLGRRFRERRLEQREAFSNVTGRVERVQNRLRRNYSIKYHVVVALMTALGK
jgi:hypothetical protein